LRAVQAVEARQFKGDQLLWRFSGDPIQTATKCRMQRFARIAIMPVNLKWKPN
jgi:hypothetical protein